VKIARGSRYQLIRRCGQAPYAVDHAVGRTPVGYVQSRFPHQELCQNGDRPERLLQIVRYGVSKCLQPGVGSFELLCGPFSSLLLKPAAVNPPVSENDRTHSGFIQKVECSALHAAP